MNCQGTDYLINGCVLRNKKSCSQTPLSVTDRSHVIWSQMNEAYLSEDKDAVVLSKYGVKG
jgi:hypothetical protein